MSTSALTDQRPPDWDTAWAAALDVLELGVVEAEGLLSASHLIPATRGQRWVPPELPGPLPGNLRARAEAILDRQVRVSHQLAHGMAVNRRELRLAQRMNSGTMDRTTPAFVDSKF
jgi:hypothetical protein